ncbi:hypothetical protein [Photobacterium galatheae]|uniref:Uncharacterized protein n=1 Tax=Photobacterium galatheae TaxID=1654360 RepID=A0A066RYJ1_9GAMM|nr:hypothetical protein [Photobacterium galatheae]KDM92463.1 hypothetical protein EA58_05850 [Photobacterium galatheae]MCM0147943.1 hypothetical protein [Photobacterium galatheae]
MFGFFKKRKKKESPQSEAKNNNFFVIAQAIRKSEPAVQIAVGDSIRLAQSMFKVSFPSRSFFQDLPLNEKVDYLDKLVSFENALNEKGDKISAFGFILFRLWLVALIDTDSDAFSAINEELEYLCKKK